MSFLASVVPHAEAASVKGSITPCRPAVDESVGDVRSPSVPQQLPGRTKLQQLLGAHGHGEGSDVQRRQVQRHAARAPGKNKEGIVERSRGQRINKPLGKSAVRAQVLWCMQSKTAGHGERLVFLCHQLSWVSLHRTAAQKPVGQSFIISQNSGHPKTTTASKRSVRHTTVTVGMCQTPISTSTHRNLCLAGLSCIVGVLARLLGLAIIRRGVDLAGRQGGLGRSR